MLRFPISNKLFEPRDSFAALCLSAFLCSSAIGVLLIAMPFIITKLGGSDREVGSCFAMNFVAYIAGCLLAGPLADRFGPKHMLQLGSVGKLFSSLGICLTLLFSTKASFPLPPIVAVTGFVMLNGLSLAFFWPPMMGWISTGHEGSSLTRRLAIFNLSWALATAAGPFVGGYLIEKIGYTLPFIIIIILDLLTFCIISIIPADEKDSSKTKQLPAEDCQSDLPCPSLPTFRWMARIALISSFAIIALMRTQLALLFTATLGFGESRFGYAITFMMLAIMAVFLITTKIHRWHYKLSPFIAAQIILMLAMLIILHSTEIWQFCIATLFVGLGSSFIYASHQYYGVSGWKKRSGRMAIHEITLSIGTIVGSIAGGHLGNIDRYLPYWFGIAIIVASMIAQLAIWMSLRPKKLLTDSPK